MTWKTCACEISSKPAIVLVDTRFAKQAPLHEMPCLTWFGVYCQLPVDEHLWNPTETETSDRLESDLIKLCGTFGHGWTVYVLHIATPGIREYYLYHSDAAELNKAFVALKANYPDYKIEFKETNDPDWKEYKTYVSFKRNSLIQANGLLTIKSKLLGSSSTTVTEKRGQNGNTTIRSHGAYEHGRHPGMRGVW